MSCCRRKNFLTLQNEKEQLVEKRAAGIKLLAELNAQLNVVRSLKMQGALWVKKQQEEQEELNKQKNLQDALVVQEEGLIHFKAQWEAIQPDLKKARQLDVQIQSQQAGVYTVSTNFAGCPSAGGGSGEEICICDRAVTDLLSFFESSVESYRCGVTAGLNRLKSSLTRKRIHWKHGQKVNEERLGRLNSFGYPSLVDEQGKIQKN